MSHCKPGSVKTDASWADIWHVMLEWIRQRAPLKNKPKQASAGLAIMSKTNNFGLISGSDVPQSDALPEPVPEAQTGCNAVNTDAPPADLCTPHSYLGADFHVNLDEQLGKDLDRGKIVRYQLAPRENWGPMSRAK